LYWDEIEYISRFGGYDASPRYPNSVRELAHFMRPHVPTYEEKEKAHSQIIKLLEGPLPSWLTVDRESSDEERELYFIFRDKLLPETWEELTRRGLVFVTPSRQHADLDDFASHTYLGLTLMAILARCCAGSVKHTITDRTDSYFTLLKHLQFLSGEDESGKGRIQTGSPQTFRQWLDVLGVGGPTVADEARDTLVAISLDAIEGSSLSVESLLRLRSDKTKLAAQLRQNYAKAVEGYVEKLSVPNLSETDAKALADDFKQSMVLDLDRLSDELRLSAEKTLLSKELVVAAVLPIVGSAVLAASGVVLGVLGGAFGIAALGKLAIEYRIARNAVFQKHPMAFLYASKPVSLY